jgi:hypothetical protein
MVRERDRNDIESRERREKLYEFQNFSIILKVAAIY